MSCCHSARKLQYNRYISSTRAERLLSLYKLIHTTTKLLMNIFSMNMFCPSHDDEAARARRTQVLRQASNYITY